MYEFNDKVCCMKALLYAAIILTMLCMYIPGLKPGHKH